MYCDFPGVTAEDWLAHAPALDPVSVRVRPADAIAALGASPAPDRVRLDVLDGRPVYRVQSGASTRLVYADTGERVAPMSRAAALRLAAAWIGRNPGDARADELSDVDQWTVEGAFRALRPMWKCAWPEGDVVYVSEATGEVVQYTTTSSRFEAYLGPIPHWLYFTPLRRRAALWRVVVITASSLGASGAALGLFVGVAMYSPRRLYRRDGVPARVPYRGTKRLHMILGLVVRRRRGDMGLERVAVDGSGGDDGEGCRAGAARGAAARPPSRRCRRRSRSSDSRARALRRWSSPRSPARRFIWRISRTGHPRGAAGWPGRGRVRSVEPRRSDAAGLRRGGRRRPRPGSIRRVLSRSTAAAAAPVVAMTLADAARTRYYVDPKTARIVGA